MSSSKPAVKRKVGDEHRQFQEKWETQYFFVEHRGIPTCLICTEKVAVHKEYSVKRHYSTEHAEECAEYQGDERAKWVTSLKAGLLRQQDFSKENIAAVEATSLTMNLRQEQVCTESVSAPPPPESLRRRRSSKGEIPNFTETEPPTVRCRGGAEEEEVQRRCVSESGGFQNKSFGSSTTEATACGDQTGTGTGPGPGLDQDRDGTGTGPGLDRDWIGTGPGLGQIQVFSVKSGNGVSCNMKLKL